MLVEGEKLGHMGLFLFLALHCYVCQKKACCATVLLRPSKIWGVSEAGNVVVCGCLEARVSSTFGKEKVSH